jgi:hypothetical protein
VGRGTWVHGTYSRTLDTGADERSYRAQRCRRWCGGEERDLRTCRFECQGGEFTWQVRLFILCFSWGVGESFLGGLSGGGCCG